MTEDEMVGWHHRLELLQELVTDLIWGAISTTKIVKANQMILKCSKV